MPRFETPDNSRASPLALLALAIVSSVVLTGFGCRERKPVTRESTAPLVVWGLWQESADVEPIGKAFTEATGVKVEYRKLASVATYEQDLNLALAEDRGPDVFVIHHTWVEGRRALMLPAPADIVDRRAVEEEFVDVVARDLVRGSQVYALPTSVDTLALYYNKDLLNAAGVARPPATWADVLSVTERVRKVNRVADVQQSAIALGTAANVNRASDIFQLLLLQSGLPILSSDEVDLANPTGERALKFYTDFANKATQVYNWNLQLDYSLDAFAEGDAAMMINYSYHVPTIRAKNPRLNVGLAPMPQIEGGAGKINFASYWPFAVAHNTDLPRAAWQFVRSLTGAEASRALNQAQQVPPARKDSLADFVRDPSLGVFAEQALSATSWPRVSIVETDAIINTMIDSVVTGSAGIPEALRRAEDQLNQLLARQRNER